MDGCVAKCLLDVPNSKFNSLIIKHPQKKTFFRTIVCFQFLNSL
jgi:hypothetical protein